MLCKNHYLTNFSSYWITKSNASKFFFPKIFDDFFYVITFKLFLSILLILIPLSSS